MSALILTLPYGRFVRRGRAAASDDPEWDVASSDDEVEELKNFMDKPAAGAVWSSFQPEDKKITKYLPPGTVADLYTHYEATRGLLGAAAVSQLLGIKQIINF